MVVEQYVARFAELSRYAPHIINTEAQKAAKFESGLRPDIRGKVLSANLKSYAPLIDLALKIERDCKDHRSKSEGKMKVVPSGRFGKKPRQFPRRDIRGRPYQLNQRTQKNLSSNMKNDQHPTYPHCGKDNHIAAECYRK
ncbi:uncharacterized protein LOC105420536 [Amborella trichopoda]|uniref:uncharacterized protein LOC105420536 n=1 Tax=Amborella trichopoda TaxID=13333 RepID=UPI0005D37613|nr:uncharacterized protein LOC105420536 [Amborella trichopoda]|eukprot:XP_011622841.1 uncharacterized protein LOC105420536 [Amborella trichopoda]